MSSKSFFFQAEDGIRDGHVTGVQTCALPILEGAMSFEYESADFSQVAGLENLKRWLLARKQSFSTTSADLETPKGIMLLGVQGSGKSLAAKAVAGAWGLPLLRLDVGALYNTYHGETE